MISERLREEITHLKEDIKRTISDYFCWQFLINIGIGKKWYYLNNVKECSNQIVLINARCDINQKYIEEDMKNKDIVLSDKVMVNEKELYC